MGVESPKKQQQFVILESMVAVGDDDVAEQPRKMYAPSVKRRLFGKADHEEVMAFFNDQLAKLYADKKQRWNFDFVAEQPIRGGHFEWQKISDQPASSPCKPLTPSNGNDKVTKFQISCGSSKPLLTSHWSKCKKIVRQTAFTKNVKASRKLVGNTRAERVK